MSRNTGRLCPWKAIPRQSAVELQLLRCIGDYLVKNPKAESSHDPVSLLLDLAFLLAR